jgi:DNA primase
VSEPTPIRADVMAALEHENFCRSPEHSRPWAPIRAQAHHLRRPLPLPQQHRDRSTRRPTHRTTHRAGMATQGREGETMTTPKAAQPVTTADLRALILNDPAFREALAAALYDVDFETNPELKYIASSYDIDLYREQADRVLRKLRNQLGCDPS